jgi:type II secretory pathway component GspD/PulD (secretin)
VIGDISAHCLIEPEPLFPRNFLQKARVREREQFWLPPLCDAGRTLLRHCSQVTRMKSGPHFLHQLNRLWVGVSLTLVIATAPGSAHSVAHSQLAFKDADIQTVIAEVAKLTETTFLFDPTRVKGKITVLAAGEVTPAQALELLRSVLALHGYVLVARPEGTWVVPAPPASGGDVVLLVVRLTYVDAADIAWTLSWSAPPGVRIVPFQSTNSVVISGPEAAVEQMVDVIRRR